MEARKLKRKERRSKQKEHKESKEANATVKEKELREKPKERCARRDLDAAPRKTKKTSLDSNLSFNSAKQSALSSKNKAVER